MNKKGTVKNLKPFVKGQSGNPKGRPRLEHSLTEALREFSTSKVGNVERKKLLAQKLWQLAFEQDNIAALKYIYDRLEGQPIQIVAGDADSPPFQLVIKRAKDDDTD